MLMEIGTNWTIFYEFFFKFYYKKLETGGEFFLFAHNRAKNMLKGNIVFEEFINSGNY